MTQMDTDEKYARDYYEDVWSKSYNEHFNVNYQEFHEILGFHYGFFEKGIITPRKAMLNMNDFVGRLLGLNKTKSMEILDVGCGNGGTSIYLASKYPNNRYTGITVAPIEIKLANKFSKEKNVNNVNFILGNYNNTGFSDNYFHAAFALESACYAQNKKNFVHEMYRILKPDGKLVIIDGFRKDKLSNSFKKSFYEYYRKERGNLDFPDIKIFKSYLEKEGFKDITIQNISKNIRPHFLFVSLKHIHRFIPSLKKRIIKQKKYGKEKINFLQNIIFLDAFIGLSKIAEYNVIKAIKK